jgi:LysM repeat protein
MRSILKSILLITMTLLSSCSGCGSKNTAERKTNPLFQKEGVVGVGKAYMDQIDSLNNIGAVDTNIHALGSIDTSSYYSEVPAVQSKKKDLFGKHTNKSLPTTPVSVSPPVVVAPPSTTVSTDYDFSHQFSFDGAGKEVMLLFQKTGNTVITNKNNVITNYQIASIEKSADDKSTVINVTDFDKPNKYRFVLTKDKPGGMVISLKTPKAVYLLSKPQILTKSIVVESMNESAPKTSKRAVNKSYDNNSNCECVEYKNYVIQPGDTYYSLARHFGVNIELLKLNNCQLIAGERLCKRKKTITNTTSAAKNARRNESW